MTQGITGISQTTFGHAQASTDASQVGRDEFLKLLTMQLKSQNPLKPYDNQEFASQLAQFSQLEQLSDIRSLMEDQAKSNAFLSQTISNTALPGMLGKTAKAISDRVHFDGEYPAAMGYTLQQGAASGELVIYDTNGSVVRSVDLDSLDLTAGEHTYMWDGEDDAGDICDEGTYFFEIRGKDGSGAEINAQTFTRGEIESVRFKSEGTVLVIDGMEVALENVTDITTS
ncbi:MAG: flagellar hook assembly protein FlgD [Candidatus Kapaibacterium sp.]